MKMTGFKQKTAFSKSFKWISYTKKYEIFTTENDIFGKGLPLYRIKRTVKECNISFGDENHIIYVNGKYEGNDPIGDLMHDFHCRKADDMKNKILADRARYLKEQKADF